MSNYPAGVTGHERAITGSPDIEWEYDLVETYEKDLDGHGTKEGLVYGRMTEGREWTDYSAIATVMLPYDRDCFEIHEDTKKVIDCGTFYQED